MQRKGGKHVYDVKVGGVRSPNPVFQGLQAIGSATTPGNSSTLRSPIRSTGYAALTPNGIPNLPSRFGATKPERGYRCPEGYQFGGRFTDSRLSTCGKQLFDLPGAIGRSIGRAISESLRGVDGNPTTTRQVGALSVSGEIIQSRSAQIPRVGAANKLARRNSTTTIVSAMSSVDSPYTRLVRRDGFVLEPVVSAAVLRTVPDNRDMEGATYITTALKPTDMGFDELGLLSNTGVSRITYVLPGGSVINIEKSRPLTVGERRKLGKTVNAAANISGEKDPATRLRYVASEMGDGIGYAESFPNISNPNEIISVKIPGSDTKTQMRKWVYESFYRTSRKKKIDTEIETIGGSSPEIGERIDNLSGAVRHLNSNGSLENVIPSLRIEALKRSQMYKTGKLKNGVILHERADGQTVFEINPTERFEHIGAAVASDVQRSLGLLSPKVRIAGSGEKRSYLIGDAQDIIAGSLEARKIDDTKLQAEDLLGLAISDWLLDTYKRNPSNIATVISAGKTRAVASINPMAGLSEGTAASNRKRIKIEMDEFFNRDLRNTYKNYFEQLRTEQKRRAIQMLDTLINRAQESDFDEIRQRLILDGRLSSSEKTHLLIIEKIFSARLDKLKSSRTLFLNLLGLTK